MKLKRIFFYLLRQKGECYKRSHIYIISKQEGDHLFNPGDLKWKKEEGNAEQGREIVKQFKRAKLKARQGGRRDVNGDSLGTREGRGYNNRGDQEEIRYAEVKGPRGWERGRIRYIGKIEHLRRGKWG